MATAGSIRAGSAYVEAFLDQTKFNKGLKQLQTSAGGITKALSRAGGSVASSGFAITAPINSAVEAASDAFETFDRFQRVFGPLTARANEFAGTLSAKVNRSITDVQRNLSSFQAFFQGQGFGAESALELSQQMQQLTLDFASFNNLTDDEAFNRFISALSGSSEVLDQFGQNIKVSALNQELLNQGFEGGFTKATEAQKALARMAIIVRELGKGGALGNAVLTADSFANSSKGLSAAMRDLAIAIGQPLLKLRAEWNQRIAETIRGITVFVRANQGLVVSLAQVGTVLFTVAGVLLTFAGIAATGAIAMAALGRAGAFIAAPFTAATKAVLGLGRATILTATAAASTAVRAVTVAAGTTVGLVTTAVQGIAGVTFAAITGIASTVLSVFRSLATTLGSLLVPAIFSVAGTLLTVLGGALQASILAVSGLIVAINALLATMTFIPTVVTGVIGGIATFLGAIALGPPIIFQILAALGLFSAVLVGVHDSAVRVGAAISDAFSRMFTIGQLGVTGIFQAILAGDWSKAVEIVGLSMHAAWRAAIFGMLNLATSVFGQDITALFINVGKLVGTVFQGLASVVIPILGGIGRAVAATFGFVAKIANKVLGALGIATDLAKELETSQAASDKAIEDLRKATESGVAQGGESPEAQGERQKLGLPTTDDARGVAQDIKEQIEAAKAKLNLEPGSLDDFGRKISDRFGEALDGLDAKGLKIPDLEKFSDIAAQIQEQAGKVTAGLPEFSEISGLTKDLVASITAQKNILAQQGVELGALGQGNGVLPGGLDFQRFFAEAGIGGGAAAGSKKDKPDPFGTFSGTAAARFGASLGGATPALREAQRQRAEAVRQTKLQQKLVAEQAKLSHAMIAIGVAAL